MVNFKETIKHFFKTFKLKGGKDSNARIFFEEDHKNFVSPMFSPIFHNLSCDAIAKSENIQSCIINYIQSLSDEEKPSPYYEDFLFHVGVSYRFKNKELSDLIENEYLKLSKLKTQKQKGQKNTQIGHTEISLIE